MTKPDDRPMTTAGLQAKVSLRRAWFEAHPNQPMPEGRAQVEALFAAIEAEVRQPEPLVCSLCLFVGESDDPRPITILNGQLVCEPHNGYFQGGDHVQAILAWKREHNTEGEQS